MRVFDRDLIRGRHYGQRSCEPHLKAEHMAAPTHAANVKKTLANSETCADQSRRSAWEGNPGVRRTLPKGPSLIRSGREGLTRIPCAACCSTSPFSSGSRCTGLRG